MIDLNKFKNIPYTKRTNCMVCGESLSQPLINLPNFPLTEIYVKEISPEKVGFVDQEFHFCENCGHGQIANIILPEILYKENYMTRTSISQSAINSLNIFLEFINNVRGNNEAKTIMDIGCNDLYALKKFRSNAEILYGIDPIFIGKEKSTEEKIEIIGDFVENVDFSKLKKPDIVFSSHTLEHIENPKKLIKSLIDNSGPNTLFFFQFPGLETLVQDAKFDQIFHQHLNYFSLKSVIALLNEVKAELIEYKVNPCHWGSLMVAFKKSNNSDNFKFNPPQITKEIILNQYTLFIENMNLVNKRISSLKHNPIYGYGAAQMLPILNYYIRSLSEIRGIIDDNKSKQGLYYINFPKRIMGPEEIGNLEKSVVIITAINSKQSVRNITSKLIELNIENIILPVNLI